MILSSFLKTVLHFAACKRPLRPPQRFVLPYCALCESAPQGLVLLSHSYTKPRAQRLADGSL